jgi:hypothetical protein
MTSILKGELAEQIAAALVEASIPVACSVTRNEVSGPPWEPILTPVEHSGQGLVDSYTVAERGLNSTIAASDVKALVLASLDIEPSVADSVTIGGKTYAIISVSTDLARALWQLQARA